MMYAGLRSDSVVVWFEQGQFLCGRNMKDMKPGPFAPGQFNRKAGGLQAGFARSDFRVLGKGNFVAELFPSRLLVLKYGRGVSQWVAMVGSMRKMFSKTSSSSTSIFP